MVAVFAVIGRCDGMVGGCGPMGVHHCHTYAMAVRLYSLFNHYWHYSHSQSIHRHCSNEPLVCNPRVIALNPYLLCFVVITDCLLIEIN
jgi:hypothetical protein